MAGLGEKGLQAWLLFSVPEWLMSDKSTLVVLRRISRDCTTQNENPGVVCRLFACTNVMILRGPISFIRFFQRSVIQKGGDNFHF